MASLGRPGSATTMFSPPWLAISASATPEESTRWRMISIAWLISSVLICDPSSVRGVRMICVPPSRSSARFGAQEAVENLVPASTDPKIATMTSSRNTNVRSGRTVDLLRVANEVFSLAGATDRATISRNGRVRRS